MIDFDRVDLDAPVEFWTPKIGDRVRVRLSAECQRAVEPGSPGAISGQGSHAPQFDGLTGRIISPGIYAAVIAAVINRDHAYLVEFDQPITIDGYRHLVHGDAYAAAELELLTDDGNA